MEAHNGSSWDVQAEMAYNGLGQRLSMDAAGVIATYVMDGDRPLTAESNGNTTFYLYGLGTIGEKTTEWNFSLPDGTNTPRQLTDIQGEITLSARYTPWGDSLELHGTGNFSFGYLGGVLDATTGLLYVGNGQYYDPATGRFLTRNVNPDSTNPYVPWNPIGAILGPLGLIALVFGRKRKRGKWDTLVIIVLIGISAGIGVIACAPVPPPTQVPNPNATATPANIQPANPSPAETPVSTGPATVIGILPIATASPMPTVVATSCATSTLIPTPGFDNGLITFGSGWSDTEIEIVMQAIFKVGERLSPFLGGMSSADAFLQTYRIQKGFPLVFITADDIGVGECKAASRGVVKCGVSVNINNPRWMVHEFGHLLQHSRYIDDTQGPYGSLEGHEITDFSGVHVTGPNPNKGGVFDRTMLGYVSDRIPDMYHGCGTYSRDCTSNQDHTARNEDFADMYLNWVYQTFDYSRDANGAGTNREKWIDDNISTWINNATY